ncbi:MAG: response regulator transcription factor [Zoogloeaceae bacterium]|jgi:two-component system alkaline phosphatase synthesis response regulator PhoP|nr:response regulator transcription factor [Zoogloeaceae bacterium]
MTTIFLVEDDDDIRELVSYAVQSIGFSARAFPDGGAFFAALREETPDLVLLDVMLPGDDGLTILDKLKSNRNTRKTPVIMLTAKGAEFDRIHGLDMGADDYVAKPFSVMELLARIKAVLRRSDTGANKKADIEVGGVRLCPDSRNVFVGEEKVDLTFKEFEVLLYLMRHENIVVSRDQVLSSIWNCDFDGESRTVDMHIKSLRKKLKTEGKIIHTIRGIGYKAEAV